MGHVAAHIFKRAIERQRKQHCCCCDCRQDQKPKRFVVTSEYNGKRFNICKVSTTGNKSTMLVVADYLATYKAAERIAAIYEETTP